MAKFLNSAETQKGGEIMALEAIKAVTEAEKSSAQALVDAQAEAKRSVAEAEKAGQAALEGAKAEANAKAKELLAQAEQRAAGEAQAVQQQTEQSCQRLKADARRKLEAAASLIVRRVVNN